MIEKNKQKVPKLRFHTNDTDWLSSKIGRKFDLLRTSSYSRNQLNYENGEVRNIHYGDIHTKYQTQLDISRDNVPFINRTAQISNEDFCKSGDVVIADASEDYADIGKALEITNTENKKILAGLHTFLLRPKPEITFAKGFLGYSFKSEKVRKQLMRIATGISVLGISKSNLLKVVIYYPSLEEQQKIADFLTLVDKYIQNLKAQKQELEKYKKGLMQKIFSQEIRFKGGSGVGYPKWTSQNLTELALVKTGTSNREDSSVKGAYRFFDRSVDTRYSNRYLYDTEVIIVAGEGLDFQPRYYKGKFDLHQRSYAVMPRNPTTNWQFLFYYITQNSRWFKTMAVGTTMPSLRMDAFSRMRIWLPILEEQQKIADFLTSVDNLINLKQLQIEKAELFKKGLLQEMFV